MPETTYLITIQATAPIVGTKDEDVLTADLTLITRRPFTDAEIRHEALAGVAQRACRNPSDFEITRFAYTTMPTR